MQPMHPAAHTGEQCSSTAGPPGRRGGDCCCWLCSELLRASVGDAPGWLPQLLAVASQPAAMLALRCCSRDSWRSASRCAAAWLKNASCARSPGLEAAAAQGSAAAGRPAKGLPPPPLAARAPPVGKGSKSSRPGENDSCRATCCACTGLQGCASHASSRHTSASTPQRRAGSCGLAEACISHGAASLLGVATAASNACSSWLPAADADPVRDSCRGGVGWWGGCLGKLMLAGSLASQGMHAWRCAAASMLHSQ